MTESNKPVKEEDERKYAVGGTIGCLIFLIIAFLGIIIGFIALYFTLISSKPGG